VKRPGPPSLPGVHWTLPTTTPTLQRRSGLTAVGLGPSGNGALTMGKQQKTFKMVTSPAQNEDLTKKKDEDSTGKNRDVTMKS